MGKGVLSKLINSDKFKDMVVNFKPRLTVGELRGHVLMLSRKQCLASLERSSMQPVLQAY